MGIKEGDLAPALDLPVGDGGVIRLSGLRGRHVVVYFYPRDATPGCTTEALEFNALKPQFEAAGATVVGVSPDSVASHARFAARHGLDIALAADPERTVLEAWGVWVEKTLYGRKHMGVERSTFLIGPDGVVRRVWRKVKPAGHAAAVLAALRELQPASGADAG
ncbi:peroxiredoxin [Camelimonas abortus]|uniref:thioredoxin-dependent peroxiredoxin n=1 Tax=Camelimonas abortus TaxID=1017184 RepID=A0ABV7LBD9_9HYPH